MSLLPKRTRPLTLSALVVLSFSPRYWSPLCCGVFVVLLSLFAMVMHGAAMLGASRPVLCAAGLGASRASDGGHLALALFGVPLGLPLGVSWEYAQLLPSGHDLVLANVTHAFGCGAGEGDLPLIRW